MLNCSDGSWWLLTWRLIFVPMEVDDCSDVGWYLLRWRLIVTHMEVDGRAGEGEPAHLDHLHQPIDPPAWQDNLEFGQTLKSVNPDHHLWSRWERVWISHCQSEMHFCQRFASFCPKLLTCWMCLLWAVGGQTRHTLVLFKVGSVGVICWSFPPGIFTDIEPFAIRFENWTCVETLGTRTRN